MRSVHRLDFGINFVKEKKKGIRTWNISIYNVYNRQNPFYYYWGMKDSNNDGIAEKPALFQISIFPVLPSVSYSYCF
jgi:hypothetical protein